MAYPDFIWQFAQHLKDINAKEGKEVAVFADSKVRVNQHAFAPLVDPKVDLANEKWDPWRHHQWIMPAPWSSEADETKR